MGIEESGDCSASGVASNKERACRTARIFCEEVAEASSNGTDHFPCYRKESGVTKIARVILSRR